MDFNINFGMLILTTPQRITEIGLYIVKCFSIRNELHVNRDGVGIVTKYHILSRRLT